jgi:hypothetical protein
MAGDGWRWRRTPPNGRTVALQRKDNANKSDCIANAERNGMTCRPT